uniref:Acetylcholine receptor subunit delta-like n=1 Tax=Crassostrea virginica TaxID=6565 RepID=A0A8B8DMI7_CRAVI|nr:acetylcholine receptor subunit delta-like [Crassostrea virginica]
MKYFILVTISILVSGVTSLYTHSLETSLRNETFIDNAYNKDTRPATKTAIKCNIKLLSLKDINTRDQTMTTVAYFSFTWIDPRLAWATKPAYATDIERIFSTEPVLFTPSMVVENSISDLGVISDVTLPIKIDKDGTVTWTPGNVYETSCDIDTTFYPFDKQTCSIVLTTRGYTSKELELASTRNQSF